MFTQPLERESSCIPVTFSFGATPVLTAAKAPAGATRPKLPAPNAAAVKLQETLFRTAFPSVSNGDGNSSSSGSSTSTSTKSAITAVHVDSSSGRTFHVHRTVLAEHSEYFRKLLAPDAGFTDSGADEVSLPDADPEAFSCLLSYMYCGAMHVPDKLLRPALQLAEMLLMPKDCIGELQRSLLAQMMPQSVLSDLLWAEQLGMAALVKQLKAYLLQHRKAVDFQKVRELIESFPDLTATLVVELAAAP